MSTDEKYLSKQVVLVGYGRVGQRIADSLKESGIPFVVAEQNRELVERLRADGIAAVSGNAADPAVLIQAHIADASMLVIATFDIFNIQQMVRIARKLNSGIEIVVRTNNPDEADLLLRDHAETVFLGEDELAKSMTGHVLGRFGKSL
jgi:CPA2 family monovalent cation:H+ antiporter-2